MPSATKAAVLQQHEENKLLNSPAPPLMAASDRDLRISQPRRKPEQALADAATSALRSGQTHYVDVPGISPLREALAAYLKDTFAASYESKHVLVTAGVQESRFLALQKIGEQFDRVLIPSVVHPGARRALGTRPLPVREIDVDEANGYLPTLESIRQALADGGSHLLYLESPSRLTGKAYSADEMAELTELLRANGAGLVVDEGLAPWVPDGAFTSAAAHDADATSVAVLGEAWPGMGLDSWFVGFVATPEQWFEPMRAQKQIMSICTNTASQYAALEAASQFQKRRNELLEVLTQNRILAAKLLNNTGLMPLPGSAQNIVAVKLSENASRIYEAIQQSGYDVTHGTEFGAEHVVRLVITLDETTNTALRTISRQENHGK